MTPQPPLLAASPQDARVEDVVLRESLRSRCRQARPAFLGMALNTALVVPLLGRSFHLQLVAAWLAVQLVLLLIRFHTARRVERSLDAPRPVLDGFDRRFRLLSLLSQGVVGSGIWMVPLSTAEMAPYWMTMLITVYGVGSAVNLAHDFRTLKLTMPVLMVQPMLFWLLSGVQGMVMAVILAGMTWMMITSARNSMNAFVDSIRIRFEKDALLEQLSVEKQATSRALEAAEQANRAKSFFLAAASHDLRQPLYAATLLADALSLHPLGTEPTALVEKQREALKVAAALFDNILDLSKFEAGAVRPLLRSIRVSAFLEELASGYRPGAEAKGLTLEMGICDATVESDYDLLARLVRNLLSNAVRYTEAGCVRLRAIEHADAVSIVVEDTGIGIPKVEQERVFKEFQQLDNPQRSRDKGVGLGLAIVRHIAQLLDHPVRLESEFGKGTRIEVSVPLAKSARLAGDSAVVPHDGGAPAAAPLMLLSGLHVWIVEDDPLVQDALQQYLAMLGCVYRSALDRAQLEQLLGEEGPPDFVILDDMLGTEETGLELAGWLAQRMPPSRLLVTTGTVSLERWSELNASRFHVLRKPLSATSINEWMRRGLGDPAAVGKAVPARAVRDPGP